MTQEDKDLLVKDLCARLNTKLVCSIYRIDDIGIGWRDEILSGYCEGDIWYEFYFGEDCGIGIDNVSKIKPYLLPLSSMTEEQEIEFKGLLSEVYDFSFRMEELLELIQSQQNIPFRYIDWLVKNNFDYRGLIPMGLAIDATNLNIY